MANVDDVVDIVVDNVVVNDSNVVEVAFNGHKGELVVVVVGVVAVVFFVDVDVNDDNDGDDVAIKFNAARVCAAFGLFAAAESLATFSRNFTIFDILILLVSVMPVMKTNTIVKMTPKNYVKITLNILWQYICKDFKAIDILNNAAFPSSINVAFALNCTKLTHDYNVNIDNEKGKPITKY
uniref:Uncharacterized protein n=1 Tax=Glossina austeni TaxID=7395 RepID=A0A1A9UEL5_GLOAU